MLLYYTALKNIKETWSSHQSAELGNKPLWIHFSCFEVAAGAPRGTNKTTSKKNGSAGGFHRHASSLLTHLGFCFSLSVPVEMEAAVNSGWTGRSAPPGWHIRTWRCKKGRRVSQHSLKCVDEIKKRLAIMQGEPDRGINPAAGPVPAPLREEEQVEYCQSPTHRPPEGYSW